MTSYGSNFSASDVEATSVKTSKLTLGLGVEPVSATAPGYVGDFRIVRTTGTAGFLYVCTGKNEWQRVAIAAPAAA